MADLRAQIQELWGHRADVAPGDRDAYTVVREAIELLDRGEARVAEIDAAGDVVVHQWLKQAILLLFKLSAMETVDVGPFEFVDKIPLKKDYEASGVRVVPGASARWGSFLGRGVVMMPSYVNIGARVGANTMVDTWATVGSCAQIGANVHLSGGAGDRGGRLPDRQPVHGHAGGAPAARRGAGRRRDPEPGDPGGRCRDRRGGGSRRRAALVDRRAGAAPAPVRGW